MATDDIVGQLPDLPPKLRYPFVVEYLIERHLLAQYAVKEGIADTEEYKRRLALYQAKALRDAYFYQKIRPMVTEEMIRQAYDEEAAKLQQTERVRARMILVATEKEAQDIEKMLAAGAKMVLLDNMSLADMREACRMAEGRAITEASGGISLETLRAIAETGVDRISIGGLTKDVRAMGATFTEDAVLVVVSKDQSTGHYKTEEQRGRSQIEDFYRKLYDGLTGSTVSKNTVESARLLAPDLMIVSGSFQPNTSNALSLPFTQVRVKVGEKWLKKNLVVFILGN